MSQSTAAVYAATKSEASLNSIVDDRHTGFDRETAEVQLWGNGVYFARDASYPEFFGRAAAPAACGDGTMKVLLCLVVTGMSCLGANGLILRDQMRTRKNKYNSFVDSLSSPEIFAVQDGRAAFPAYIIQYH